MIRIVLDWVLIVWIVIFQTAYQLIVNQPYKFSQKGCAHPVIRTGKTPILQYLTGSPGIAVLAHVLALKPVDFVSILMRSAKSVKIDLFLSLTSARQST